MRNLLALIGAVVVLVVGLGWYLGWYTLGTEPGKVEVDFHTKKIADDIKKGSQSVGDLLNRDQKASTEKKVEGQPTSNPKDTDGGWKITPGVLPSLPSAPTGQGPVQFNPDGSPKITIPPPPSFPNAK